MVMVTVMVTAETETEMETVVVETEEAAEVVETVEAVLVVAEVREQYLSLKQTNALWSLIN